MMLAVFVAYALGGNPGFAQVRSFETGFLDRVVVVAGATHRYQVYVPAEYSPDRAWPVILYMHGDTQRGSDGMLPTTTYLAPAIRADRARFPVITVFTQAGEDRRFMEPEVQQMALSELAATEREFHTDKDRVYLFGVSNGAAGAIRLAYNNPKQWAALVALGLRVQFLGAATRDVDRRAHAFASAPNPFAALAERIKDIPSFFGAGDADEIVPVDESRQLVAALRSVGATPRYVESPGLGHVAGMIKALETPDLFTWLFAQRR